MLLMKANNWVNRITEWKNHMIQRYMSTAPKPDCSSTWLCLSMVKQLCRTIRSNISSKYITGLVVSSQLHLHMHMCESTRTHTHIHVHCYALSQATLTFAELSSLDSRTRKFFEAAAWLQLLTLYKAGNSLQHGLQVSFYLAQMVEQTMQVLPCGTRVFSTN